MTPERVIAAAIRYDHRPAANARDILKALEDAGWTLCRPPLLPETERVYRGSDWQPKLNWSGA